MLETVYIYYYNLPMYSIWYEINDKRHLYLLECSLFGRQLHHTTRALDVNDKIHC